MWQSFECCGKKIIGKPCEGEPHARFEVAGDGNGLPRHRLTLPESARQWKGYSRKQGCPCEGNLKEAGCGNRLTTGKSLV